MKFIDLTGKQIGYLTILERVPSLGRPVWKCKCQCGNITIKSGRLLREGQTKSCGCLKKENILKIRPKDVYQGLSKHSLYTVWKNMKDRCLNPKNKSYNRYGKRGISICKAWLNYETFYTDLIDLYNPLLELDRINNDGNYELSNCRFVSKQENINNSTTKKINLEIMTYIRGSTENTKDLIEKFNLSKSYINKLKRESKSKNKINN